jgi:hypothetical protein
MPEPVSKSDKKAPGWAGDVTTKAKSERKFTKVESNFVKIDELPNQSIEGTILSRDIQKFANGTEVGRYRLEQENGEAVTFLGSTQLDEFLGKVPDGSFVRVTLTGKSKTGANRSMKEYTVEVAE